MRQAVPPPCAFDGDVHQSGAAELLQVLRSSRRRHVVGVADRGGKVASGGAAGDQEGQRKTARGMRERSRNTIDLVLFLEGVEVGVLVIDRLARTVRTFPHVPAVLPSNPTHALRPGWF